MVEVVAVDVPRVEVAWVVVVQLEDVAARPRAEHLAPALLVEDRREQAVVVQRDAQQLVLEQCGR